MNRGSAGSDGHRLLHADASMRPRFMNRGSTLYRLDYAAKQAVLQ